MLTALTLLVAGVNEVNTVNEVLSLAEGGAACAGHAPAGTPSLLSAAVRGIIVTVI